jgi:hypothetical protein
MREMQINRFKATLSLIAGMLLGTLIYLPYAHTHWQTVSGIIAICAGYTVIVFGLTWSVEECFFATENPLPKQTVFWVHCIFLALIAEIVNFALYIHPSIPAWLDNPIGTRRSGRPGSSGADLLEAATLLLVLVLELFWLLRNVPRPSPGSTGAAE